MLTRVIAHRNFISSGVIVAAGCLFQARKTNETEAEQHLHPLTLDELRGNPHLLERVNLSTNEDKTIVRVKPKDGLGSPSFECSFSIDNELMAQEDFSEHIMDMFTAYEPAWFQANWLMTLYKTLQIESEFHQKQGSANQPEQIYNESLPAYNRIYFKRPNAQGRVVLDVARTEQRAQDRQKVILVVPGTCGDSNSIYVRELLASASRDGYSVVVVNSTVPKNSEENDLEIVDFSKSEPLRDIILKTKDLFGDDIDLYAIGFSLGANSLMSYLGQSGKAQQEAGIKAAVSISPAFDVLASGVALKSTAFGMIDSSMLGDLKLPFLTRRYHTHAKCKEEMAGKAEAAQSCLEFDGKTRARILGLNSAHVLWRHMSCDPYIPHIQVPFLTVVAKDDPITQYRHVPVETLQRNRNSLLTVFDRGGHVNFYAEKEGEYENRSINFALGYLKKVQESANL